MADLEKRWEGELSAVTNTPRTDAGEWPSPDRAQEITFEGRGCVVMSPEEYGALHEHARQLELENADLTAKLAAAQRDAERYWWLRDRFDGDGQDIGVLVECRHRSPIRMEVDAAIDAAIREAATPPAPGPTTP